MPPIVTSNCVYSNQVLSSRHSSHHSGSSNSNADLTMIGRNSSHHSSVETQTSVQHNQKNERRLTNKPAAATTRRRPTSSSSKRSTSLLAPLCLTLVAGVMFLNVNQFSQSETMQLAYKVSSTAAAAARTTILEEQQQRHTKQQQLLPMRAVNANATDINAQTTTTNNNTVDAAIANIRPQSPYAYMFVIGGIDPDTTSYKGFLYNVMVTVDILRQQGSTADTVLLVQLHPDSRYERLPEAEANALSALGVHTLYLAKPQSSTSFSDIVMEKFRALQLTQYRRVMFLDADVLPFTNMDYLFEISDPKSERSKTTMMMHPNGGGNSTVTIIKPNFIMATKGEPCNAGVFMVEPKPGDYQKLLEIVKRQREQGQKLPYPHFSKEYGWGHSFLKHGDEWQSTEHTGKRWIWHAVHSDQGLLYQWVRYHEASYTAFRGSTVDNFVRDTSKDTATSHAMPQLEASFNSSLVEAHEPPTKIVKHHPCGKHDYNCRNAPYSNFRHFVGKSKPWQYGYRGQDDLQRRDRYHVRAYFEGLFDLSQRLGLGFTTENVNERLQGESPLGKMALHKDVVNVEKKT